jgi:hypothetical protein
MWPDGIAVDHGQVYVVLELVKVIELSCVDIIILETPEIRFYAFILLRPSEDVSSYT